MYITDRGLISRVHKGLLEINKKMVYNPVEKYAGDLSRHFTKEDIK